MTDFISKQIHDFLRPKQKTPEQWADFYLAKTTPLQYKVGMKFVVNNTVVTIIQINQDSIMTSYHNYRGIISKRFGAYFEYKGFEVCLGLQWKNLISNHSLKRLHLLSNFLSYKYLLNRLTREITIFEARNPITSDSSFLDDFKMGYAAWGNIIVNSY